MKTIAYTLRALSPLHCGIGQGLDDIDLPTARNSVTGHPFVPGSSLKGVMKAAFQGHAEAGEQDQITALFGKDGNEHASAISIADANLLALPVRSYYGTFAYMASPYTLQFLKQLLVRTGRTKKLPNLPSVGIDKGTGFYKALITKDSLLVAEGQNNILLEELDLLVEFSGSDQSRKLAEEWASVLAGMFFPDEEGQQIFKKRFVIADDNALNFLSETALPVEAKIAIDSKTGTVKSGALWYEESVPSESLFVGSIGVDRSYNQKLDYTAQDLYDFFTKQNPVHLQIGGKATTGKGLCEIHYVDSDSL